MHMYRTYEPMSGEDLGGFITLCDRCAGIINELGEYGLDPWEPAENEKCSRCKLYLDDIKALEEN